MKPLSSHVKVLMATLKPATFTDITTKTGLSPSTVAKWLKIHEALGNITKTGNTYKITDVGINYLKNILTEILDTAIELGLINKIELYINPDEIQITKDEYGTYEMKAIHYGMQFEVPIIINLSDEKTTIINSLRKLAQYLESLTD